MLIIAEIGTSHAGNFNNAVKLIDAAEQVGANAVKFQWIYADEILHPDTGFVELPTGKIRLYDRFKELEVSPEFYKKCRDYAHSKGLKFICSPFGIKSLHELLAINPDYIKIASPELNHFPLLEELNRYRLNQQKNNIAPIKTILSSGVSTLEDIKNAIDILGTKNVALLHCITSYPAIEEQYNLKLLETLHKQFDIEIGISDHSLDPILVPVLSISQGAKIIEKHITLSKTTDGLDDPVALTVEQFGFMCHAINQSEAILRHYGKQKGKEQIIKQMTETYGDEKILKILGDGIKKLAPQEEQNYGRTNRSLHFMKNMKKGEKIFKDDVKVLRTEKILTPGISPKFYNEIIGKTLAQNVTSGEGVQFNMLEQ